MTTNDEFDGTDNEHTTDHLDYTQPPAYPGVDVVKTESSSNTAYSFSFKLGGSSTVSSPSCPPANFAPLARPTNYLTIERENAFNGTYSIDPALPALPGAVKSQGRDGKDLNAKLSCKGGWLSAVIDIVSGADAKVLPARLETTIEDGIMGITLHDRQQNRFRLRAVVQRSTATIRIPSTFVGSIATNTQHSTLRFDPAIQRQLTTISDLPSGGCYFLGDFAAHGYKDEETWHMDHLDIEADCATIVVKFSKVTTDEGSSDGGTKEVKGFFSRLFPSFSFDLFLRNESVIINQ